MSRGHTNIAIRLNRYGTWEYCGLGDYDGTGHLTRAGWCQCFCSDCTTVGKHSVCICYFCQNCPDRPKEEAL